MIFSVTKASRIFLFLVFLVPVVQAQFQPAGPLPVDPGVRIGKLSNGLTYYIRKNSRPEKKAELRLVVNAGSVLEDPDQQGLAHFMEHMNFNGSVHFPKNDLVEYLQSIGVEFGADLNAYTSFDETVYILPVPADDSVKLEKAFTILEDWAGNALLETAEIEKERGVVLEESRIGKGASERMRNIYFPVMFNGSLYAQRLPIGKDSIISHFTPSVLRRFYNDWYRPGLMAVVVVGDIDPERVENLIRSKFSHLKSPAKARKRPGIITIPERKNSQAMVLTDKEQPYSILSIYHSREQSTPVTNWKGYRDLLVQDLYNKMMDLRFAELTQQPKPPFVFGGSNTGSDLRGYKGHTSFALLGDNPVEDAVQAIVRTTASAREYGFLTSELERAKSNLINDAERAVKDKDKTESAVFVDAYVAHFLQGSPILSVENRAAFLKSTLPGISLEEVNAFAKSLRKNQGEFVLITAPDKEKTRLPADSALMDMVKNAARRPVNPYTEAAIDSSLLKTSPTPGRIVSESTNSRTETIDLTLSNGVTVTVKSTDFKNDEIVLSAARPGGYYRYSLADKENAKNTASLVSEMGVGTFTPTDLRKFLSGKTVQVSPYITQVQEGVSGNSSVKDIEEFLQLVHLYFTSPSENSDLFQSYIARQKGYIQNIKNDPFVFFEDTLAYIQYGNNPWTEGIGNTADYDRINLDRAFEIYREIFGNAYGMHFTFVGNIDMQTFKPLLEKYIGSLPASPMQVGTKDVGLRPVRGVVEAKIHKGAPQDKKSMVNIFYSGEATYTYENLLHILATIDVINILITRELREKMSEIYGGGLYGYILLHPYQHYVIGASFPCGPENTENLTDSLFGIIRRIREKGCDQADLDKVKETWKNQRRENIRQNNYWARQLTTQKLNGTDPATFLTHDSILEKMTIADIQATARKYLGEQNYVRGILYPEK
jgi:zinc protease